MKRSYLVHCWDGHCDDGWYPWIAKELKNDNVEIIRWDMPNTAAPKIEEWVNSLATKVKKLDKDTYFIGHSIGCQTILRYLEKQEVNQIGGILFVAPWLNLLPAAIEDEESQKVAEPWLNTPINFNKIKEFTNNIYCLFSDNDYFVPLEEEKKWKEKLNAHTLILPNLGHISADDNIYELQEILDLANQMIKDKNL